MANITIRDVAKKAGVGVGTVSRVLNDSPSVSSRTRAKVLRAIEEMDYQPNPIARRLSLGKTLTIAVIVPFLTRPSFVERLRGVESILSTSEYDFVIYNVETVKRRDDCFWEVPRRDRIDGLLVMSLPPSEEESERFIESGIPTVLIDTYHDTFSHVIADNVAGGQQATDHLIQMGHRKIGYISDYMSESPFAFQPVIDRYKGYRQALAMANIPFEEKYTRQVRLSQQAAQESAKEILSLADPPTAIFAYSDTQAYGVLRAAEELNIPVPESLSVIGFDDIELSEYMHLTTVRQELFDSGVHGAQLLLQALAGDQSEPQVVQLPTSLVQRRTTAPVPT